MQVVCQGELCRHEVGGGELPAGNERLETAYALGGVVCWHWRPPCLAAAPRTLVAGVVAVEVGGAEVGRGGAAGGAVCGGEVEEGDVAQVVYQACVWRGQHAILGGRGGGGGGLTTAGVLAPLADEFGPGEGGCARGGGGGGGGPGAGSEGVGECEAVVRPLGSHRV